MGSLLRRKTKGKKPNAGRIRTHDTMIMILELYSCAIPISPNIINAAARALFLDFMWGLYTREY